MKTPKPADTPFLRFWSALNDERTRAGYVEVPYGVARYLWDSTLESARREMHNHFLKTA